MNTHYYIIISIYSQRYAKKERDNKGVTIFEPKDGGTLMRFTAWVEARFPLNLLLPFLVRLMRRQNDKSFAVLKQLFESGMDSKASAAVQRESV